MRPCLTEEEKKALLERGLLDLINQARPGVSSTASFGVNDHKVVHKCGEMTK